jgi:hypothetical protein
LLEGTGPNRSKKLLGQNVVWNLCGQENINTFLGLLGTRGGESGLSTDDRGFSETTVK